jgi:two-component system nitrate/nitrite response regulator NarL
LIVMQPLVSTELVGAGAQASDTSSNATSAMPLTKREAEVLALLSQGLANKVIAARLGISEATVKTHIAAVYEKLNARNRAEAVVAAARHGLITL